MSQQSQLTGAVFLSYASQDAEAAARICDALRAAGVEVWLDKSELRGGDAWDAKIKLHIHECALFVPIISAHTNERKEGYFRREWNLATRRMLDMATDAAFLVPVVVDETRETDARVPEEFFNAQWTRLPGGDTPLAFAERVRELLAADVPGALPAQSVMSPGTDRGGRVTYTRARNAPPVRNVALAVIALLILVAGAIWYYQTSRHASAAKQSSPPASPAVAAALDEKSIAVLPFVDMSAEKNQGYMSDGIAEELLNLLSKVPDLKVIARTSSFAFKGQNVDIVEIAKKLNVAHVLEGSVRTSGDKLRITAQLIRTTDSTHVWSERYDRSMNDIFAVQDEIATAIVRALQLKLKGDSLGRHEGGTQNVEAYRLYLRAMSATNENTKASLEAAVNYAERAIELDPNYGRAWNALSWIVVTQTDNGFLPGKEGYERGRQLALHALKLSPNLAEAHASLAYVYQPLEWNWAEAEVEVQRSLAIDPTDPLALQSAGVLSTTLGQWDKAVRQLREALVRDPLNTYTILNLGIAFYLAGRLSEAEEQFRQLLELEPNFLWTRRWLSKTLLAQGKPQEALTIIQQEVDEANRLAILPVILQAVGRKTEADTALNALITNWSNQWPASVAQAYAYRGDHDRALEWLERSYQLNDTMLTTTVGEPLYENMTDDPRFIAFLRKMKLPERW
jgi:TolB-like protein/Tfp pilus assembly protein PilF